MVTLLETAAGQGSCLGCSFEELGRIIGMVDDKQRVGICVDTCHIFAAGYDRFMAGTEKAGLADHRKKLLAQAHGRVLEIGGGTGANLQYYGDGVEELRTELVGLLPEGPLYFPAEQRTDLLERVAFSVEDRRGGPPQVMRGPAFHPERGNETVRGFV